MLLLSSLLSKICSQIQLCLDQLSRESNASVQGLYKTKLTNCAGNGGGDEIVLQVPASKGDRVVVENTTFQRGAQDDEPGEFADLLHDGPTDLV